MIKSLALLTLLGLASFSRAQAAPLLTFYEPQNDLRHPSSMTFDPAKPLLVIRTVREKRLGQDGQGVLIRMTAADTEAFSRLTTQFSGQYLIVQGLGDVMEVIHITAPIEDGYLGFRPPVEKPMADYLRSRLFPVAK